MTHMDNTSKVLVCVDCQNDFVTGDLGSIDAQNKVKSIVNKIDEFEGDLIVFTLDTHEKDYLQTLEGKALPIEHCIRGTEGWALVHDIELARERAMRRGIQTRLIMKHTFGSVYCIDPEDKSLVETIMNTEQSNVINTGKMKPHMDIELVGFCTDICVISNALILKAFTHDFADITVDASCCAGTCDTKHESAIDVMESCQIIVTNKYE